MSCAVDHALNQHLANCDKSQAAHEFTEGFLDELLQGNEVSQVGSLVDVISELDESDLHQAVFELVIADSGSKEEKEALISLCSLISNKASDLIEEKAEEIHEEHLADLEEEAAISRYESQLDECANWY